MSYLTDISLFFHFIGLALLAGGGIANKFVVSSALAMKTEKSKLKFMLDNKNIAKMPDIGLVLLLVSGITMMALNADLYLLQGGIWFTLKMVALALLILAFGGLHMVRAKLRKTGDTAWLNKLSLMGLVTGVLGVSIIALAVMAFH